MSSARPVKLACLVCRAAKIRCDGRQPCSNCSIHNEQCRYEPSRRGGARRGPLAAQELARKRAQRGLRNSSTANYRRLAALDSQQHYWTPTDSAAPSLLSPSPLESSPHLADGSLETIDTSLPALLGGAEHEVSGALDVLTPSIRAYSCDKDLINAYYIFIHPYFPLLPPPASPQYEDKYVALDIRSPYPDVSTMPYWPTSPLGLAVAALLAPIPPQTNLQTKDDRNAAIRHSYADLYARSALESLQGALDTSSSCNLADCPRSTLHPDIPGMIEPVLALALLSLYEYCQRGSVPRMRTWANLALTSAMDLSLHVESSDMDCLDAHRRCWWTTLLLVYQSSILNGSDPIVTFDDHRITTMFPEFRGCREPWPLVVNAQVALLRSCSLARTLIHEPNTNPTLPRSTTHDIHDLDVYILNLAAEVDRFRCVTHYSGTEADASRNLWAIANALTHTARLTLFRVRAFPDQPLFRVHEGRKSCDLLAAPRSPRPVPAPLRLPRTRLAELNTVFPCSAQDAVQICLQSALVVARVFRRLPSPNPAYTSDVDVDVDTAIPAVISRRMGARLLSPRSVPYMAIFEMQALYILSGLLARVQAAMCSGMMADYAYLLPKASAVTAVQDAERLVEEMQCAIEALAESIRADAMFKGIGGMVREVQGVLGAMTMD
ncbi:Zn(II)2Cys6 transcription factor [Aspergillus heterothallicus]